MVARRTYRPDIRRFLTVLAGTAAVAGAVGITWGREIARALDGTATTETGWLLFGWLLSGPPILLAALSWHDRRRLRRRQRRDLSIVAAIWIGLSMLFLPGLINGSDRYFGAGRAVVEPLTIGWTWGALGNLVGITFAAVVLLVQRDSVRGRGPSRRQSDLTARFVEVGWMLALAVSLSLALYGATPGIGS